MKNLRTALVLLLIVMLVASLAMVGCKKKPKAGTLDAIMAAGKMVVGTSADYPPFEFVDESGNFDGFDIALIKEIGKRMGVQIEIKDMDFGILIDALKQGQIDAIIACMTATEERDKEVDFTIPYDTSADAFLVKKGSGIVLEGPEDAQNYIIGYQTGTIHEEWVTENLLETNKVAENRVMTYPRADLAIMDLVAGRIQVLILDEAVASKYLATHNVEVVLNADLSGGDPAIAIMEGSKELQAKLNEIIQQLLDEGFMTQLSVEYKSGE
ncbi:MAG: ABC transporter substrate-binding protein [Bacillota bacterium]